MFEHEGHFFHDENIRPFELARRALANYYNNECELLIVSGMPEGVGKSNYISHAIADIHGYINCHDAEKLKWMRQPVNKRPDNTPIWEADYSKVMEWTKYLPTEVINFLKELRHSHQRIPIWHWDDGGSWLNSMSFHDPFVKGFMQFLPLARTVTGMVVISTPVEEWVLKKIHAAKGALHGPVVKLESNKGLWRRRQCKAYRKVMNAWHNRSFPQYQWLDEFPAIVPDDFYRQYKPIRDFYSDIAIEKMDEALKDREEKGIDVTADRAILEEMANPNQLEI